MSDAVVLGQPVLMPTRQHKFVRTLCTSATHSGSLALISYWQTLETSGGMRMCRDIPSRALGKLLQHILIAEPNDDWSDARIRLAGTALIERFGRDIAGTLLSDSYKGDPDGAKLLLQLGAQVSRSREPGLVDTRIFVDGIEILHLESVLLPIFAPDGVSAWTLVGAFRF